MYGAEFTDSPIFNTLVQERWESSDAIASLAAGMWLGAWYHDRGYDEV